MRVPGTTAQKMKYFCKKYQTSIEEHTKPPVFYAPREVSPAPYRGRGIFFLPTGHFKFIIPSIFLELVRQIANRPTEVSYTEK